MRFARLVAVLAVLFLTPTLATAQDAAPTASRFATGSGPAKAEDGTWRLLDAAHTPGQSNALAFDRANAGAFEQTTLRCTLRVMPGGDGGAILFLNTAEFGATGPAPFLPSVVEPNLRGTFAVGIDVHNPPNDEPFGDWGNYQHLPQREVSLHFDGRELVKRVAPAEFRGDFADCVVQVQHVSGGAEVTVKLGEGVVYDRYFVANYQPYPTRLAFAAGTRNDAATEFDLKEIAFAQAQPASRRRPPLHVEVFNHVLTDNSKTAFAKEVSLPPAEWNYGRVLLTLDLHDAGPDWDEWDRCGEVSIIIGEGDEQKKLGIVPFITSYRTECHWVVDVTHFRPLLAGKVTLEVAAGTTFYKNRGYMMSVSLDFRAGGFGRAASGATGARRPVVGRHGALQVGREPLCRLFRGAVGDDWQGRRGGARVLHDHGAFAGRRVHAVEADDHVCSECGAGRRSAADDAVREHTLESRLLSQSQPPAVRHVEVFARRLGPWRRCSSVVD